MDFKIAKLESIDTWALMADRRKMLEKLAGRTLSEVLEESIKRVRAQAATASVDESLALGEVLKVLEESSMRHSKHRFRTTEEIIEARDRKIRAIFGQDMSPAGQDRKPSEPSESRAEKLMEQDIRFGSW